MQLHALNAKLHAKQDLQLARASCILQIILTNIRAAKEVGVSEEEIAAVSAEQNDPADSGDNMRRFAAKDIPPKSPILAFCFQVGYSSRRITCATPHAQLEEESFGASRADGGVLSTDSQLPKCKLKQILTSASRCALPRGCTTDVGCTVIVAE